MYQIFYTNRMKKDVKRIQKRGKDISKLLDVLELLQNGKILPEMRRESPLLREYALLRKPRKLWG